MDVGRLPHGYTLLLTQICFEFDCFYVHSLIDSIPEVDSWLLCLRSSGYELVLDIVSLPDTFLGICFGVIMGTSLGAMDGAVYST